MAKGEVGTFDETSPPIGQTFGNYRVWTQLAPYVEDINGSDEAAKAWYAGGDAWTASLGALERMLDKLQELTKSLTAGDSPTFTGAAAEAFQQHVTTLTDRSRKGVLDVIRANNFGAHTYAVGTAIVDFRKEFWAIVDAGHRLTDKLRQYASEQINAIYAGVDDAGAKDEDMKRALEAAYQAGERWTMTNLRYLLTQLAADYRELGKSLKPLTVAVQERTTPGGANNSNANNNSNNNSNGNNNGNGNNNTNSGSGNNSGSGSGGGTGGNNNLLNTAEKAVDDAVNGLKNGNPEHDAIIDKARTAARGAFDELRDNGAGAGTGGSGSGGAGTGGGTGGTGNAGGGADNLGGSRLDATGADPRQQGLSDASQAAGEAIDRLRNGDPVHDGVLDQAKQAAQGEIGKLAGAGGGIPTVSGNPALGASGASGGSGGSKSGGAAADPAVDEARRKALDDAQRAIQGLSSDGPGTGGGTGGTGGGTGSTGGGSDVGAYPDTSSADPVAEAARREALEDAQEVVDGLHGDEKGSPAAEAARDDALADARRAAKDTFDDMMGKSTGDPVADAARDEALEKAKRAALDEIDELDRRGAGDVTPEEAREQALEQAQKAVDDAIKDHSTGRPVVDDALEKARDAFDDAISETGGDGTDRSAAERAAREDALDAAYDAIGDLRGDDAMSKALDADGDGKPDGDLDGDGKIDAEEAEAIRDDALADAKESADKAIDKMIDDLEKGKGTDGLTDEQRQDRIDALEDARDSAGKVIDELIDEGGDHSSTLSDFLNGKGKGADDGAGGGSAGGGGAGGGTGGAAGNQNQPAPLELAPVMGQTTGALDQVSQQATAAVPPGGSGMPMSPPMGGGAGQQGDRDRERNTWLVGEEGMWGEDEDGVVTKAVGRD